MNEVAKKPNDDQRSTSVETNLFDIKVMVQPTPNPNALKFIVNREVKAKGKITYNRGDECPHNDLAKELFKIEEVTQLHFFENVITVTFKANSNLLDLEGQVINTIKVKILSHDPNFKTERDEEQRRADLPPDLKKIEEILDRTIRPALQGDGGDLEVVSYIDNELSVRYQGACGTCPSSTMGTLMAIEGLLRDEFDPDITVVPI